MLEANVSVLSAVSAAETAKEPRTANSVPIAVTSSPTGFAAMAALRPVCAAVAAVVAAVLAAMTVRSV